MSRVIVLGLDGACWPLIEPWLQAGDLPNLALLRGKGIWGPLQSQLPPVTSPNWRCYATGCNPAKLGVFWWEIVDRAQKTIRHPSSRDYRGRTLWSELADAGRPVAVLNFPSGYPPSQIQGGYFTAGGPGARDSGFTYPPDWEMELKDKFNYRVHPTPVLSSSSTVEKAIEEILSVMQSRFDVAFDLLNKNLDFIHITIFYINVLQHFCYRGAATRKGWKLIDQNLGQLIELASAGGYNLFLMSDHGCSSVDTIFHVNTWLQREGYLKLKTPPLISRLSRLGLTRQRLVNLARRSGLAPLLRTLVPEWIQRSLPDSEGTYQKEAKGERIDWEESVVLASGQGPIYLLISPQEEGYPELRDQLQEQLTRLTHPETGHPIAKRVLCREDIYSGPFLDQAPDLVFEQASGIHTSGGVGHPEIFSQPQKWAAENVLEGLFLAWGPDIADSKTIDGVRIIDLAPTILHLMDLAISKETDGRILSEIYSDQSEASRRSVQFRAISEKIDGTRVPEDESEIAARLKALGYLD